MKSGYKVVLRCNDLKSSRAGTDYLGVAWSINVIGRYEVGKKYIFERPDKTTFDAIAVSFKNNETLFVDAEEIDATRYHRFTKSPYALVEKPEPAPVRSNILEPQRKPKTSFRPKQDDMYSKRALPVKAVQALVVIQRCSEYLQKEQRGTLSFYNFEYTVEQAVKALEEGAGYGTNERCAYLPKVIRHLMVQVSRNLKDPLPVVRDFLCNEKLMSMLDKAWMK